jgi:hypothetical protein
MISIPFYIIVETFKFITYDMTMKGTTESIMEDYFIHKRIQEIWSCWDLQMCFIVPSNTIRTHD